MPQPTPSDVHVDALLTDVSVAYVQSASNFIFDKVFPMVPSAKQSNKVRIYTKNDWFRDEMKLRAPGAPAVESGYNVTTTSYYCDVFAIGKIIDEQTRANYDAPGAADTDATQWLSQMAMLRMERQWMSDCFATGKWGTDVTGGSNFTVWSNFSASDPKGDILTGKKTILTNTGLMPNTLVVSYAVHEKLVQHPLIRDQFKYTSAASIDEGALAAYFGIDRYLVTSSVYATNEEGGTAAYSFASGSNALLCYCASSPSLMMPSCGYTFVWQGLTGMSNMGTRVRRFDLPDRNGEKIEIEAAWDNVIVASDLGYFFSTAI